MRALDRVVRLQWIAAGVVIFISLIITSAPMRAQVSNHTAIRALVTDSAGHPLSLVQVSVVGADQQALTDSAGVAVLRDMDWGNIRLRARRIGFKETTTRITVPAGGNAEAHIVLPVNPIVLTDVTVSDTGFKPARLARTTKYDDFYRRRAQEAGTFMTREDIDKRNPDRTIDLFMGIAGVRVIYRGSNPFVSFSRCTEGVEVFIDGQRLNDGLTELRGLHPNQIEAIEIYHGLATVPPQFSPKPNDCAAIVVWTRYM